MALGPIGRRSADRADQLAGRVLDQPADLRGGHRADRDLRAREPSRRRCATSTRSARCCRDVPVRRGVRAHRGARSGLDATRASSRSRSSRCWPSSASCATSPGATTRSSTCASSAASRSPRRPLTAICAFAAWGAFLFMMSLYLQGERGYSAMHTGLIYLPIAIGALLFSPLSGRLVGRYGARPSLAGGRRADHRGVGDADLPDRDDPVWALLIDLRGLRHRLLDGQRADHQRGRQRHAAGPGRRRIGGDVAPAARSA